MPIVPSITTTRLSQADFQPIASEEMRHVFDIHNEFGRFFEEQVYKRELACRMEGVLLETMYELPTYEGVEEIVVNAEVIEGRAQPLVIYAERRDKGGAA